MERFVGVGNPFAIRRPRAGESVLDVGCGVGLDVLVAGLLVGSSGRAVGIDLTPEMVELPRQLASAHPSGNVEIVVANVETLPFPDASFDSVISNAALNLVPDKDRAFDEIHRVLKPGGAFVVADLIALEDIPDSERTRPDAWST